MKAAPRPCSIADTLALVGEKYSLLVLREISLGVRRFDRIARNTGAPRDILTARLKRLVEAGILEKVRYSERPPRYEYQATAAGEELQPVLVTLMAWGDRHLNADDRPIVLEHRCGEVLSPRVVCAHCGDEADRESLRAHVRAPGWTTTGPQEA
ncbi:MULTISPECIES: winged helix-turn-helix transcriptional regulator [Streptomyces]|uniref:Transcriptional regulator, HxlR family n=1 Tax=Streptomyces venezuelae (strain ATCC 10712 / CBS 650.69 / DSM 40230 / JCM 4526 / NBRC 13096 / PD 04745) TaxID=953739 RepID=F2RB51_STRVP|nr:helix-turn-helix domain-containing protein [Streptomyces venezuelae]APE20303.1 transcriptional regulator [Streptomyces venezuelae]QER97704.1 transcriptional regulator [Streptomyces venezuelae ATCC 10712]QES04894.1 transcriptional regulator [Streptomyces venezuelae]CCA54179.1 Transcriptional regulator, HxlR family [Streptomyces venezuelae ATCC 10712]